MHIHGYMYRSTETQMYIYSSMSAACQQHVSSMSAACQQHVSNMSATCQQYNMLSVGTDTNAKSINVVLLICYQLYTALTWIWIQCSAVCWLVGGLVCWLAGWWAGRLVGCSAGWLLGWLVGCWPVGYVAGWLIVWAVGRLLRSLVGWLVACLHQIFLNKTTNSFRDHNYFLVQRSKTT